MGTMAGSCPESSPGFGSDLFQHRTQGIRVRVLTVSMSKLEEFKSYREVVGRLDVLEVVLVKCWLGGWASKPRRRTGCKHISTHQQWARCLILHVRLWMPAIPSSLVCQTKRGLIRFSCEKRDKACVAVTGEVMLDVCQEDHITHSQRKKDTRQEETLLDLHPTSVITYDTSQLPLSPVRAVSVAVGS